MSFTDYNGSCLLAMTGKNCVAIATDKRLGVQTFTTVSENFQKVFKMNDHCLAGFAGLATDVQTFHQLLKFRMNLYALREQREMTPKVLQSLLGRMLYERRFSPFFISPLLAGLTDKGEPVICTYDFIGSASAANDFVVSGSGSDALFGVCEAFYKPDMDPDQLFETISQCLMAALDRTACAGWGAYVYILTPEKLTCKHLETRMD